MSKHKFIKLKGDKELLLENLLKVEATDHKEIQEQIRKNLIKKETKE